MTESPAQLVSERERPVSGAGEPRGSPGLRSGDELSRLFWPFLILVLLLALNAIFTAGFLRVELRDGRLYGSLIDILNRGAPVMLVALGMTLVIGTGGIDLSVGAVMAITGAVAAGLMSRPDYSVLSAVDLHGSVSLILAAALAVALIAGIGNGVLVACLEIQPIVATLILMVAGRGVAQLLTSGQIITFENPALEFVGRGVIGTVPFPILLVAAVALVAGLLMRATATGLFIEAVGGNPTASRYAGVNARLVKLIAYACCGLCAGVAGLIQTADIKAADANNTGLYLELDAILAVCIGGNSLNGGRFSLVGSLLGAVLIQTLNTSVLTMGIPPAVTLVMKAALVITVCLIQSPQFRSRFVRSRGVMA
jgi:galactofuranose transport system permease protein